MSRWRVTVAVIFVVVAAVGVAVFVWVSPPERLAAITGLATLALVGVTGWYVRLTHDLVKAQRDSVQQAKDAEHRRAEAEIHQAERQALVSLWRQGVTDTVSLKHEREHLASLGASPAWEVALKALETACACNEELAARCDAIILLIPDLPEDLRSACWHTATGLMTAAHALVKLDGIRASLELGSWHGGPEPTVEMLRERWDNEVYPSKSAVTWDDLVGGRLLSAVEKATDDLEEVALARAQSAA